MLFLGTAMVIIYSENLFGVKYYYQEFVPKEETNLDEAHNINISLTYINTNKVE